MQPCYLGIAVQHSGALRHIIHDNPHEAMLREASVLVEKAKAIDPLFQNFARAVAHRIGVHKDRLTFGPIKTTHGIVNKALYEKDGDIGQVRDILRATIEVDKIRQIEKAANFLKLMVEGTLQCIAGVTPYKVKNTFNDAGFDQYGMLKTNFAIQGFHSTEIQLCLPRDQKDMERSHTAYGVKRACDYALNDFNRLSPRVTEEEKALLSLHLMKRSLRAARERKRYNTSSLEV